MIDFVFGGFGVFIRWIFVYKFNSKKMSEAYNSNIEKEGAKNNMAGLFLIPIAIIIGIIINYLDKW
ncbi:MULTISPECIES: hypothetical protein [Chryseobacterium]|uniref:hypothetical protein n=1 Tax=Chryseobacterium TaxID=59732 RepID=UPI0018753B01|nr:MULTISPECIES: hypothetical protein [Chryseobacterium]MBE4950857.1 hypothetical protein [Chryseobacterium culicis]MCW1961285.1 hypothetical protein [Chryseobacterium viscerum]